MRVLVVGTVPPPGGRNARELARVVAQRVSNGDEVEILSPDPRSAAHHSADLRSLMLPLRLMLYSPRFDALELRIETRLPLDPEVNRVLRGLTLFGLGVTFGMYSHVTLRLDSPIPLPGGVGGRATKDMWRRASRIVVQNDEDYKRVLAAPGVAEERIEIAEPVIVEPATVTAPWPAPTEPDLRNQVLAGIRHRAANERLANTARVELGAEGVGPLASSAFTASQHVSPGLGVVVRAVVARVLRELSNR